MDRDELIKGILALAPQTGVAQATDGSFEACSNASLREPHGALGELSSGGLEISRAHVDATDLDSRLASVRERRSSILGRLSSRLDAFVPDASKGVGGAASEHAPTLPRTKPASRRSVLEDLLREKERLESLIARMQEESRRQVVAEIQMLVKTYGLTEADLGMGDLGKRSAKAAPNADPGKRWTGKGGRPKWLEEKYVAHVPRKSAEK